MTFRKILNTLKNTSISVGAYPFFRAVSRQFRRSEKQRYQEQKRFYESLLEVAKIVPPALAFDIGANIGEKSESLLRMGHRVISFEPNSSLIPELRARLDKFENWKLCNVALGSHLGLVRLEVRDFIGQASLLPGWGSGAISEESWVGLITLDSAINEFGFPEFIKIDVEGLELEVLNGLSRAPKVLSFEFHTDERIEIGRRCVKRALDLGGFIVNVVDGESLSFCSAEWIDAKDFLAEFPGCMADHYAMENGYGELYLLRTD